MTLDDIRAMSKPTILASEAAQVLGCTPQLFVLAAVAGGKDETGGST